MEKRILFKESVYADSAGNISNQVVNNFGLKLKNEPVNGEITLLKQTIFYEDGSIEIDKEAKKVALPKGISFKNEDASRFNETPVITYGTYELRSTSVVSSLKKAKGFADYIKELLSRSGYQAVKVNTDEFYLSKCYAQNYYYYYPLEWEVSLEEAKKLWTTVLRRTEATFTQYGNPNYKFVKSGNSMAYFPSRHCRPVPLDILKKWAEM